MQLAGSEPAVRKRASSIPVAGLRGVAAGEASTGALATAAVVGSARAASIEVEVEARVRRRRVVCVIRGRNGFIGLALPDARGRKKAGRLARPRASLRGALAANSSVLAAPPSAVRPGSGLLRGGWRPPHFAEGPEDSRLRRCQSFQRFSAS